MPQLAEHQLRVGAVGQIVAENWRGGCDELLATKLCLLHDMGNIVKFDLSDEAQRVSMFGKIDNLPHWQEVQKKYLDQYGSDAHAATNGILREMGEDKIVPMIDEEVRLYLAEADSQELDKADVPTVIMMYGDFRVIPQGVVSYQDRVEDLRVRYGGGKSPTWLAWTAKFEQWIQERIAVDLDSITEEVVRPRWDALLKVEI